jgi:hypothetical protein
MNADGSDPAAAFANRHVRFGWWSMLVFATFGLALETLHGFKLRMYLDVSNETRRLMWTLAHAHGTLLGIVHVIFGITVRALSPEAAHQLRPISRSLIGASVLLPGGFVLGGIVIYGGDPGLGALLIPVGGVLLLVALFLIARVCTRADLATVDSNPSSRKGQRGRLSGKSADQSS